MKRIFGTPRALAALLALSLLGPGAARKAARAQPPPRQPPPPPPPRRSS